MDAVLTHARTNLLRHLRSPALLWLALATPVLAPFLIPDPGAAYALVGVNGKSLALDPGSLGLQLGVLAATLATPLAYIYLRAGATRHQPREVQVPTPGSRVKLQLGSFVGDTIALWLWALALAVAGVILSLFRTESFAPLETMVTALAITVPALAIIAGVRTLFASRPRLQGWLGDVAFFFVWTALLVMSVSYFEMATGSAFGDPMGFVAPLAVASPEPVVEYYIGGSPKGEGFLDIDAWRGVANADFLLSRLAWLAIAAALAALGGLVFKSARPRPAKAPPREPVAFSGEPIRPAPLRGGLVDALATHIREILNAPWKIAVLGIALLAAALFTFRGIGGAVALFALVVLLAEPPARWRSTAMLMSLPAPLGERIGVSLASTLLVGVLVSVVAGLRAALSGDTTFLTEASLLPLATAASLWALGWLTKSPFAGRVIGLILWYGYLNFALA